ncbi:MAG TPA: hypothetical protein VF940_04645, partial [Streptosporangiaceae bacterium]
PRLSHVVIENSEAGNGRRGVSAFKRRRITLPGGRAELRTVRPGVPPGACHARGRADRPRSGPGHARPSGVWRT